MNVNQEGESNAQYLEKVAVADGYPVGLGGGPLHLVDLAIGRVGEYGVLDGARQLLYVPDERLSVVARRAYVTGGVWRPGDAVDARAVIVQTRHGRTRRAHVEHDHLDRVHGNGRQVVGILLVPGDSQQRIVRRVLVDDGRVLQVAQVEHAHRAVGAHRREHVATATGAAKRDVVDFFVVRDQLGLHVAAHLRLGATDCLASLSSFTRHVIKVRKNTVK